MNLLLSPQAAYAAPIIMMSQNLQAAKDRLEAHNDYLVNQKAEEEIRAILNHLTAQDQALALIHQMLLAMSLSLGQSRPARTRRIRARNDKRGAWLVLLSYYLWNMNVETKNNGSKE